MSRTSKALSSLALLAAMAVPVASFAAPLPDDHHDHDRDRRYYDRDHKDYHRWDTHEDAAYRHWMESNHHRYVDYGHLRAEDQRRYWAWRHDHPQWRP
jgi:hypothetical protein